ncbi:hypothetical protein MTYP_01626 [Methylophilaceae bacterium]|nr:hypothetical protein MTYP_01626 [Methylophilaceae bacterium]
MEIVTGATIGEMSLIDGLPDSPGCITSVPTDFAVLTQEGLDKLQQQAPRLANKLLLALLRKMTRRLRGASHPCAPANVH